KRRNRVCLSFRKVSRIFKIKSLASLSLLVTFCTREETGYVSREGLGSRFVIQSRSPSSNLGMEVNRDDADEFLPNFFEQLESLSLSEEAEVAETTDPCNINALLEPLPSQFQKQAIPQQAPTYDAAGFLENLDQLLGPDTIYTEDQSVQIGSNKRILDVDPTQHLFSSNLNQCYMAETSTSTNPTLQTGRSPSQGLFTVPPESIQFKPVGSSVDTCASADSNQQQPRKRQRR
ncbi:unnamed protein product, partial [Brassica oleracea var. botrytis]